jgi:hypothetical protein
VLLEVAVLVLEREDAELGVDRDDPTRVPRAVPLEVGLDDVAHREGVKGVGEFDRDPVEALARDVGLEVAVVVEHIDGVVVAVDREHLGERGGGEGSAGEGEGERAGGRGGAGVGGRRLTSPGYSTPRPAQFERT